ncbi:hypothetical protein CDD83_112 [Cordyceps sp. RAO-2017]|nr:hypothetical protein CDD83_112 [Cordyceps sp. RAO-2017]
MGSRGGWGRGNASASGPFSTGFAGSSGAAGGWFGGGVPGGGFPGGGGRSMKSEGKGFGEADGARMREARINADKLHVMTPAEELDSEDEAMMTALSNRTSSTMPMGIYRREHKETGVVVATTAELEAAENANGEGEEDSLWVDGDGAVPLQQIEEQGVWDAKADKTVRIKAEPGLEDRMDLDIQAKPSPGKEKKPALETKPKKEVAQDPEDRTIQEDLRLLATELGAVTVEDNGETKTEAPANKDGRMYLFQFPPLIPPLRQVAAAPPRAKVKDEPDPFGSPDGAGHASASRPVDLTTEDAGRRQAGPAAGEGDEESEESEDDEAEEQDGFRSQMLPRGGLVGQLNVRKSGKVELDWGGMTLEMSPAAGMSFLTTAIIVEENDEKAQHGVVGGDGIGMGKIMGRFVLAPIWSDEEEWKVAPHELLVG